LNLCSLMYGLKPVPVNQNPHPRAFGLQQFRKCYKTPIPTDQVRFVGISRGVPIMPIRGRPAEDGVSEARTTNADYESVVLMLENVWFTADATWRTPPTHARAISVMSSAYSTRS